MNNYLKLKLHFDLGTTRDDIILLIIILKTGVLLNLDVTRSKITKQT